jgi:TPR repeat protein
VSRFGKQQRQMNLAATTESGSCSTMPENENQSLVRRPAASIEVAANRRGRILSSMVGDALALARPLSPLSETSLEPESDPEELCQKGKAYYYGTGVPKNFVEAVKFFRKAAERGHADAQNHLGVCYTQGRGVPRDYSEAFTWYHKAAEQGDAQAEFNLGVCYEHGWGKPQDYTKSAKWYRKAAEQGDAYGQYKLGSFFENGCGVSQDYGEAFTWYRKAAEQGTAKESLI